MIKRIMAGLIVLIFCSPGIVQACSIHQREETEIGPHRAIRGVCSTDRRPITCEFKGGAGTTCNGPAGSFTGLDLDALISAACACSIYQSEYLEQGQPTDYRKH